MSDNVFFKRMAEHTPAEQNAIRAAGLYHFGFSHINAAAFRQKMGGPIWYVEQISDTEWWVTRKNEMTWRVEDHGDHYRVRDSDCRRDASDNWKTIIKIA